jgi:hypothetical protein
LIIVRSIIVDSVHDWLWVIDPSEAISWAQ